MKVRELFFPIAQSPQPWRSGHLPSVPIFNPGTERNYTNHIESWKNLQPTSPMLSMLCYKLMLEYPYWSSFALQFRKQIHKRIVSHLNNFIRKFVEPNSIGYLFPKVLWSESKNSTPKEFLGALEHYIYKTIKNQITSYLLAVPAWNSVCVDHFFVDFKDKIGCQE